MLLVLLACATPDDPDRPDSESVPPDTDSEVPLPDEDGDGFDATVDCDDSAPEVFPGADEVCDGLDNDCDGLVDDDDTIVGGTLAWDDDDRDGFGEGDPSAWCEVLEGWAPVGGDCDDLDDQVFPGADEACDDVDQDCDGTIDEGGVSFETDAATTALPDGEVALTRNGTVRVCEGIWTVNLVIDAADVEVIGEGEAILDGAGGRVVEVTDGRLAMRGVTVQSGAAEVGAGLSLTNTWFELSDVVIRDNVAAYDGGGLRADSGSTGVLTDVLFLDNVAGEEGGGVALTLTGEVELHGVTFEANQAGNGGGMAIEDARASLTEVAWIENLAGGRGGGLMTSLAFVNGQDLKWERNEASQAGGALAMHDGLLTVEDVVFGGNHASSGGAAWMTLSSSIVQAEFGSTEFTDNTPQDMQNGDNTYDWTGVVEVECRGHSVPAKAGCSKER